MFYWRVIFQTRFGSIFSFGGFGYDTPTVREPQKISFEFLVPRTGAFEDKVSRKVSKAGVL